MPCFPGEEGIPFFPIDGVLDSLHIYCTARHRCRTSIQIYSQSTRSQYSSSPRVDCLAHRDKQARRQTEPGLETRIGPIDQRRCFSCALFRRSCSLGGFRTVPDLISPLRRSRRFLEFEIASSLARARSFERSCSRCSSFRESATTCITRAPSSSTTAHIYCETLMLTLA